MSDFDADLQQRLLRLEAASPQPAPISASLTRLGRNRARRRPILLAATAAVMLGAAAAVWGGAADERAAEIAADARIRAETEQRLAAALNPVFPEGACVPAAEAVQRTRTALDAAGLAHWSIGRDSDLLEAECARWSFHLNTPESVGIYPVPLPD